MNDLDQYGGDPTAMMEAMGPMFAVVAIIGVAVFVLWIFCWWKIFSKAGYNGALSLIFIAAIIPLVGPLIVLGLVVWFAFSNWPALRRP